MGEYFRPWRRKIGVVTLVIACVFSVGWVQSLDEHHAFCFASAHRRFEVINSLFGMITWGQVDGDEEKNLEMGWHTYAMLNPHSTIEWRWHWHRFGVGHILIGDARFAKPGSLCIPYWSIVLPLTLLSAWLLLSKPKLQSPARETAGATGVQPPAGPALH